MKLYATVESERASKGQGGNDYLDIVIKDETEAVAWNIHIETFTEKRLILELFSKPGEIIRQYHEIKGKKQKGECEHKWQKVEKDCYWCKNCDATKDSDGGIIA